MKFKKGDVVRCIDGLTDSKTVNTRTPYLINGVEDDGLTIYLEGSCSRYNSICFEKWPLDESTLSDFDKLRLETALKIMRIEKESYSESIKSADFMIELIMTIPFGGITKIP